MSDWWDGMGAHAKTAYWLGGIRLDRIATHFPARSDPDQWLVATEPDAQIVSFADVRQVHRLAPVFIECLHGSGAHNSPTIHFTWPPNAGPMLEIQAQMLEQGGRAVDQLNCVYMLRALLYHCRHLARSYCDVLLETLAHPFGRPTAAEPTGWATVEPYYEFEAIITAIVRFYETLRYPLWRVFGDAGSMPRSFSKTIDAIVTRCPRLEGLISPISRDYDEAKSYRDCIQHNAHFGAAAEGVLLTRLSSGIRIVSARLPDNPESKSSRAFTYNNAIDALTLARRHIGSCFEVTHLLWQEFAPNPATADG